MARLYDKKVWLNDQTKLSAKNLNHIEKGIEAVADAVDAVENQLETFKDKVVIGEFNDNKENTLHYIWMHWCRTWCGGCSFAIITGISVFNAGGVLLCQKL